LPLGNGGLLESVALFFTVLWVTLLSRTLFNLFFDDLFLNLWEMEVSKTLFALFFTVLLFVASLRDGG
jgi:hypothetical protein